MSEIKKVHAETRKKWRAWLKKNHKKESRVWLIKHKRHTKKPAVSHRVSMEEAICFGWIDTVVKRIDEDIFAQCFVPRTKNSRWSRNTFARAKEMIKQKKMTSTGTKWYEAGLKKPIFEHLPKNPQTPMELTALLKRNKGAREFFENLAPSYKRNYIVMIENGKLPETRKKWAQKIYDRCKQKKKPNE